MNNHGKGKAIFIILIPIFIIAALIIVDTLISYLENKRFKSVTENIISETMNREDLTYDDYYDNIKRMYERNNYDVDMLYIEGNEDMLYLENSNNYFGLFTSIIGYNFITTDVDIFKGFSIPMIPSIKKIDAKEGEIKIFGVTFKVKKASKSFVKVTATKSDEEKSGYKFEYEK